jgi:hypothetical protein
VAQKKEINPFFTIPGDSSVPALVRIWGTVLRWVGGLIAVLLLASWFLMIITHRRSSERMAYLGYRENPGVGLPFITQQQSEPAPMSTLNLAVIAVGCAWFYLGKRMREGYASAIHMLGGLAALQVICSLFWAGLDTDYRNGLGAILWALILYVPPLVVAYCNWDCFSDD